MENDVEVLNRQGDENLFLEGEWLSNKVSVWIEHTVEAYILKKASPDGSMAFGETKQVAYSARSVVTSKRQASEEQPGNKAEG